MEKKTLDEVMQKIAKLKKLYEGAKKINSQEEAEAASVAINKLLVRYNLTLEEVGSAEEKEANTVIHEEISGYTYKSIGGKWEYRLTDVICNYNFCKCYQYGRSQKNLMIVGESQNVETVKWLLGMLKERFVAFSKDRYKYYINNIACSRPMSKDKFQRDYLLGCVSGLNIKLKEEQEREKREEQELAARISALVVRKDAAITAHVEEVFGRVKTHAFGKTNYNEATSAGYKDGYNTTLNKPISGGRSEVERMRMLS